MKWQNVCVFIKGSTEIGQLQPNRVKEHLESVRWASVTERGREGEKKCTCFWQGEATPGLSRRIIDKLLMDVLARNDIAHVDQYSVLDRLTLHATKQFRLISHIAVCCCSMYVWFSASHDDAPCLILSVSFYFCLPIVCADRVDTSLLRENKNQYLKLPFNSILQSIMHVKLLGTQWLSRFGLEEQPRIPRPRNRTKCYKSCIHHALLKIPISLSLV